MDYDILINILIVFMIIGSIISLSLDDLVDSAITIFAVSLFMSLAFFALKAPELGAVLFIIELAVLLVIVRKTAPKDRSSRSGFTHKAAALFLTLLAWTPLFFFFHRMPMPKSSGVYLKLASSYLIKDSRHLSVSGMAEASIIFAALTAVIALFIIYDGDNNG